MTDSLMNSFNFLPVKGADICWIDAKVDYTENMLDPAMVLSAREVSFIPMTLCYFVDYTFLLCFILGALSL